MLEVMNLDKEHILVEFTFFPFPQQFDFIVHQYNNIWLKKSFDTACLGSNYFCYL